MKCFWRKYDIVCFLIGSDYYNVCAKKKASLADETNSESDYDIQLQF